MAPGICQSGKPTFLRMVKIRHHARAVLDTKNVTARNARASRDEVRV
jgi:hypothetical protein